jgi:hypothetical protein
MDVAYHGSRNKNTIPFETWAKEVRAGIPSVEAEWVTDAQLQKLYDEGIIVFVAWYDVGELFKNRGEHEKNSS